MLGQGLLIVLIKCKSRANYDDRLTINYRITGEAGNRIRDTCVPSFSCGSRGGMWTNASMPTTVGEYRTVPLYGSWAGNCSW